jgi:hypothetical protein
MATEQAYVIVGAGLTGGKAAQTLREQASPDSEERIHSLGPKSP